MSVPSASEIDFIAVEPTSEAKNGREKKNIFAQKEDLPSLDKARIREELESSLLYLIDCGFPCALDGIGILFPVQKSVQRVTSEKNCVILSQETIKTVDFEKTEVIYQCHRTQFVNLLEEKDISDRVFERVSSRLSKASTELDVRREIRNITRRMRTDTITHGWSNELERVGLFVAHHNRQGENQGDWFAGADIFLDQAWQKVIRIEKSSQVSFPELHSPFEPFEMQFGPHQTSVSINLSEAITAMGYESELPTDLPRCEVRLYNSMNSKKNSTAIFVTSGLRQIGFARGNNNASEIVIQLVVDHSTERPDEVPEYIQKLVAAAALLASSSKTGRLINGVAADLTEYFGAGNKPNILMSFPYKKLGQQLRCLNETGSFYISLVTLITPDEAAALSANHKYLLSLFLSRKGYQQELHLRRSSVFNKTVVDENFTVSRALAV